VSSTTPRLAGPLDFGEAASLRSPELKLNFWQILGVVLLIAGVVWWVYEYNHPKPASVTVPIATQPK
jgi:hypothetical protein